MTTINRFYELPAMRCFLHAEANRSRINAWRIARLLPFANRFIPVL